MKYINCICLLESAIIIRKKNVQKKPGHIRSYNSAGWFFHYEESCEKYKLRSKNEKKKQKSSGRGVCTV